MDPEFKAFETEMNRGFLQILVLTVLDSKMYGYGMIKHLSELGYGVEENTLYPLLRRLEKNGWIRGEWDVSEDRPKKFYVITDQGRIVRDQALGTWAEQSRILSKTTEVRKDV